MTMLWPKNPYNIVHRLVAFWLKPVKTDKKKKELKANINDQKTK